MSDFAPTISAAGIDAGLRQNFGRAQRARARFLAMTSSIEPTARTGSCLACTRWRCPIQRRRRGGLQCLFPGHRPGQCPSSVVKINGLRRKLPSRSQAEVRIGGVVGTVIRNGIVSDGTTRTFQVTIRLPAWSRSRPPPKWMEPSSRCQHHYPDFTRPCGWQTATNPLAAIEGRPVESDAELRIRQPGQWPSRRSRYGSPCTPRCGNWNGVRRGRLRKPGPTNTTTTDCRRTQCAMGRRWRRRTNRPNAAAVQNPGCNTRAGQHDVAAISESAGRI